MKVGGGQNRRASQGDLEIRRAVTIDIARDHAADIAHLTRCSEGTPAVKAEGLVAGGVQIGVKQCQPDDILPMGKIGDDIARSAGAHLGQVAIGEKVRAKAAGQTVNAALPGYHIRSATAQQRVVAASPQGRFRCPRRLTPNPPRPTC